MKHNRLNTLIILFLLLAPFCLLNCAKRFELRYPSKRWLVDDDRQPIKKPKVREETLYWDGTEMQLFYQIERLGNIPERTQALGYHFGIGNKQEALNVNNFDEVANSTWFTNRLGKVDLAPEQIAVGPDKGNDPSNNTPWTIIRAKTHGQTPGFLMKDSLGNRYFIKFDPPDFPELVSSAEVISTAILYAFGYNVPENYIAYLQPDQLLISEKATKRDSLGYKVPFTQGDLEKILKPYKGQKRIRVLASKFLDGEPIGPLRYHGLRADDKNDRIPHEHRRELRGYRMFSAFIDHTDSREANTLDMFVRSGADETGFLKHYLIDFGNTLGSHGLHAKEQAQAHEYFFGYPNVVAGIIALGSYQPTWLKAHSLQNIPAIGFFDSKSFTPIFWRPVYPNPGFQNMTDRDAFWAAKILAHLSDDSIRKIVEKVKYTDVRATNYISATLIERKNKIADYWFRRLNPLDNFRINVDIEKQQAYVEFSDLRDLIKTTNMTRRYRYCVRDMQQRENHTDWIITKDRQLYWPESVREAMRYVMEVQSETEKCRSKTVGGPSICKLQWGNSLDLVIDLNGSNLQLLGLRRY